MYLQKERTHLDTGENSVQKQLRPVECANRQQQNDIWKQSVTVVVVMLFCRLYLYFVSAYVSCFMFYMLYVALVA